MKTQWYVTFHVTITMSASSFTSRSFNFFRFHSNIIVFVWNVTVNVFESLSAPACSPLHFPFSCSLDVFVSSSLRIVIPSIRQQRSASIKSTKTQTQKSQVRHPKAHVRRSSTRSVCNANLGLQQCCDSARADSVPSAADNATRVYSGISGQQTLQQPSKPQRHVQGW